MRKVRDSMGELEIDENALYQAQTQRAINNFPISYQAMPEPFVRALVLIKTVAAETNADLDCIEQEEADAIVRAARSLLSDVNIMDHFPIDIFQTGSGTSSNMNANEVLATLAERESGLEINPNDHVNFGQSSNDVIPTAIHVSAAIEVSEKLLPALEYLEDSIRNKAEEVKDYCKTGRTHLMDAMPIRMDQSLLSWADQVKGAKIGVKDALEGLKILGIGGTAVGTGINTHPEFSKKLADAISKKTKIEFKAAENPFPYLGSQDAAVRLSGQLKSIAVVLIKISNDLRWMNSGPLAGLGEITLEALQPGSSIMPGKVNPVIPEAAAMVGAQVIGNDTAISIAGQSGNFELNVMLPIVASNLLSSILIVSNISILLADKAIKTFEVNKEKLDEALHKNPILVTALNPVIGYSKAAEIAKRAYTEKRPIIEIAAQETDLPLSELEMLLNPLKLTEGGL